MAGLSPTLITKALDWPIAIGLLLFGFVARSLGRRLGAVPRSTVAVVRPGGLGDFIYQEMAIRPEDNLFPVFFIEGRSAIWAKHKSLSFVRYDLAQIKTLVEHAGKYSTVIVSEQRYAAAMAYAWALLAKGGRIICFDTQKLRTLATTVVHYSAENGHEAVWFRALTRATLGMPHDFQSALTDTAPVERQRASDGTVWIGLSGSGVPSRQLTAEEWTRVAISLGVNSNDSVRIAAQPSDLRLAKEIATNLTGAQVFEDSFNNLCKALATAKRVITVDGGFAHIAAAMGAPVSAVFTAGVVSKWVPYSVGSEAFVGSIELTCRPCTRFGSVPPCPNAFACKTSLFSAKCLTNVALVERHQSSSDGLVPPSR